MKQTHSRNVVISKKRQARRSGVGGHGAYWPSPKERTFAASNATTESADHATAERSTVAGTPDLAPPPTVGAALAPAGPSAVGRAPVDGAPVDGTPVGGAVGPRVVVGAAVVVVGTAVVGATVGVAVEDAPVVGVIDGAPVVGAAVGISAHVVVVAPSAPHAPQPG